MWILNNLIVNLKECEHVLRCVVQVCTCKIPYNSPQDLDKLDFVDVWTTTHIYNMEWGTREVDASMDQILNY